MIFIAQPNRVVTFSKRLQCYTKRFLATCTFSNLHNQVASILITIKSGGSNGFQWDDVDLERIAAKLDQNSVEKNFV